MFARFNVGTQGTESRTLTLRKAFFTYATNDRDFEASAKQLQDLDKALSKWVHTNEGVPELAQDPFELEENELELLYDSLYFRFTESVWREEQMELQTLSQAENVKSIQLTDSFISKLAASRESQKQKANAEKTQEDARAYKDKVKINKETES